MLKDCIEILKEKEKNYKGKNSIEFYTDSYLLDDGIYFLVDLKSFEYKKMTVHLMKNKSENKKENEFVPNDTELSNKFKILDFLSKPITPKIKIDSKRLIDTTNCFSIGFKKEQYFSIDKKTKNIVYKINNNKSIEDYFEKTKNNLLQSDYFQDFKEYEQFIDKFAELSIKIIEENYLKEEIKDTDYIKIFTDLPIEKYILLKNIYDMNYSYLKEENNYTSIIRKERKDCKNKIPVNFISLNDKKPFNANKTRKVPAINYENTTDRINRDYLSKYLILPEKTKDFENRVYIEVRNDKNKGFGFEEYKVIPRDIKQIKFNYDNYLCLNNPSEKIPETITKLEELIKTLHWFKYKTEDKEQKNSEVWSFFKDDLILWEKTGNFVPIKNIFEKSCLTLIQNTIIIDADSRKAQIQFNIYESLKTYFIVQKNNNKLKKEDIRNNRKEFFMSLSEKIKKKIMQEETASLDNDEEFFFVAGQITKYLVLKSKSDTDNFTDSLAEGVLCSQRTDYLINEVVKLYEKYKHALRILKYKNTEFSNLCAMLFEYKPTSKFVNKRMLFAGYLHSSVIKKSDTNNIEKQESEEA